MNILDENIVDSQVQFLRSHRIRFRQIGQGVGRQGMKDDEIIPLLHRLRSSSFFTRDRDFFRREPCHNAYCLVFLDVGQYEIASFIRRFLAQPEFRTRAQRMGNVIRVTHVGSSVWRRHARKVAEINWPT